MGGPGGGAPAPAGFQGAESLGGGQGSKPPEAPAFFYILKVFLTCIFVCDDEIPKKKF